MTLDEILKMINNANSIVILTHESPDGDAVGSCLAMKLALESLGKKPDVIIPEYSRLFKFLPGTKDVMTDSAVEKYDLAISLDCANLKRLTNNRHFENASRTIVIDHHGSNNMYGDLNYVNPVSPACCEVLIGMFEYFGIEITKEIGSCIIAGIITDTGGFQYQATTAETFEFASELLRKGVNISDIYTRVLQTVTKPNFELKKRVINRMEILENGKVTFTYITKQDEEEAHAEPGDHEGLVEIGRNIEGVEVAIFIREKEEQDGDNNEEAYKVSMRSSEYVNVSDICIMFGGGGHPRAAGALVKGDVETVKQKVLAEVRKYLK